MCLCLLCVVGGVLCLLCVVGGVCVSVVCIEYSVIERGGDGTEGESVGASFGCAVCWVESGDGEGSASWDDGSSESGLVECSIR